MIAFSRRFCVTVVVASIALVNLKQNIQVGLWVQLQPDDRQLRSFLPDAIDIPRDNGTITVVTEPPDNRKSYLIGRSNNNATAQDALWRQQRSQHFYDWYEGTSNQTDKLQPNADTNGPILDFLIAGFPKCGTTTLEANLGYYAPMPIADVCTPVHQTVYYAYKNWPKLYAQRPLSSFNTHDQEEKLLRGSKCPRLLESNNDIRDVSTYLPKTKLIVGIRHPVLWFQSFWNMHARNSRSHGMQQISPYNLTQPCRRGAPCVGGCPTRLNLCLHRADFHIYLARLGKTALTTTAERRWLVPYTHHQQHTNGSDDHDEYPQVPNWNITNPVFIYEQTTLRDEPVWDSLAQFLGMDSIRHDRTMGNATTARTRGAVIRICDAEFDALRVTLLRTAHAVSHWLLEYLIPVANIRSDVVIPNVAEFAQIVQTYQEDPCGRLHRSYNKATGQVQYTLAASAANDIETS